MRGNERPIVITVAASDPILLAVAHGGLALAFRARSYLDLPKADLDRSNDPVLIQERREDLSAVLARA